MNLFISLTKLFIFSISTVFSSFTDAIFASAALFALPKSLTSALNSSSESLLLSIYDLFTKFCKFYFSGLYSSVAISESNSLALVLSSFNLLVRSSNSASISDFLSAVEFRVSSKVFLTSFNLATP